MNQTLAIVADGMLYLHPLCIIFAMALGSWLPAIVRTINNLSRPLWALLRRL